MKPLLTALAASLSLANAGQNEPPKGFTALFNGVDFAGWNLGEQNAPHWKVVDGIIDYDGKGKSLPTAKGYGDFELQVDWKIGKGADSGIYLRGKPQVQIWDIDAHKEGSGGLWNNKKTHVGEKPLVPADNPVGEWNTFVIRLVGDKVTVHLNGKLVVDNAPMEPLKKGDGFNIYKIAISAPESHSFLNRQDKVGHRIFTIDYTKTIEIEGGATITLRGDGQNGKLISNFAKHIVPDVAPAPKPFHGQFVQMDVVKVEEAK